MSLLNRSSLINGSTSSRLPRRLRSGRRKGPAHARCGEPQLKRKMRRRSAARRPAASRPRRLPLERLEDRRMLATTGFLLGLADVDADSASPLPPKTAPLEDIFQLLADGGRTFTNSYAGTPFGTGAMFRTIGATQASSAQTTITSSNDLTNPGTTNSLIFVYAVEGVEQSPGVLRITSGRVMLFATTAGTFEGIDPTTWGVGSTPVAEWDLKAPEVIDLGGPSPGNIPADAVNTFRPDAVLGLNETESSVLFRETAPNDFIDVTSVPDNIPPFFGDEGVFVDVDQSIIAGRDPLATLGDPASARAVLNSVGGLVFSTTVTGAADGNFFADFSVTDPASGTGGPGFTPMLGSQTATGDFVSTLRLTLKPGVQFELPEIHGRKFEDLNANGVRDEFEPGLPGWEIRIQGEKLDGSPFPVAPNDVITTVENGEYWFIDDPATAAFELVPGIFTISEVLQPGWVQSFPAQAGQFLDLDETVETEPPEETQVVAISTTGRGPLGYQIELGNGRIVTNVDFGNYLPGSIHGYKFEDLNDNGIQDEGEQRRVGVEFTLTGTDGTGAPVNRSATTNDNGEIWLEEIVPGSYTLTEVAPPGVPPAVVSELVVISGREFVADQAQANELIAGGIDAERIVVRPELAVANQPIPGSIHGHKYEDLDGNGVEDVGEPRLAGWRIFLDGSFPADGGLENGQLDWIDANGLNGLWDPGEGEQWIDTNGNGEYWFMNLPLDTYLVREVLQPGWAQSAPTAPVSITIGGGQEYVAEEGQANLTQGDGKTEIVEPRLAFGNYRSGSLHWLKFEDTDANGVYDPSVDSPWSSALPQISFEVAGTPASGPFLTTVSENDDGEYWLENLDPGTYTITEITSGLPAGIASSEMVLAQDFTIVSGQEWAYRDGAAMLGEIDVQVEVVPNPDQNGIAQTLAFGNYIEGSIHGIKYIDTNGNGIRDPGEAPQGGVTFTLTGTDGMDNLIIPRVEFSDALTGEYWFTGLKPGIYAVTETLPSGQSSTTHTVLDASGNPTVTGIVVTSRKEWVAVAGQAMLGENLLLKSEMILNQDALNAPDLEFGNSADTGSIHGYKWHDYNRNGIWDQGETGLNDWIIYIDANNDGNLDWTDIDADNTWDPGEGEQWVRTMDDPNPPVNGLNLESNTYEGTTYRNTTPPPRRGAYWFEAVATGQHVIREVVPPNWIQSYPIGGSHTVIVEPNQAFAGTYGTAQPPNFGNYENKPGSIHGYVFHDIDMDGFWDEHEPALPGKTVYIDDSPANGQRDFANERIFVTMEGYADDSTHQDPYASQNRYSRRNTYSRDTYAPTTTTYTRQPLHYNGGSSLWEQSWHYGRGSWASKKPPKHHVKKDPHKDTHRGAYWIEGIYAGTYIIRVDAPGYVVSPFTELVVSNGIPLEPGQHYHAPYHATSPGNIGIYMPENGIEFASVAPEQVSAPASQAASMSDTDRTTHAMDQLYAKAGQSAEPAQQAETPKNSPALAQLSATGLGATGLGEPYGSQAKPGSGPQNAEPPATAEAGEQGAANGVQQPPLLNAAAPPTTETKAEEFKVADEVFANLGEADGTPTDGTSQPGLTRINLNPFSSYF